jgi:hypothetical protein
LTGILPAVPRKASRVVRSEAENDLANSSLARVSRSNKLAFPKSQTTFATLTVTAIIANKLAMAKYRLRWKIFGVFMDVFTSIFNVCTQWCHRSLSVPRRRCACYAPIPFENIGHVFVTATLLNPDLKK